MLHSQPLPDSELEWTFTASSGPGGQNVNKTATKAQLRWNVLATQAFSQEQKLRLFKQLESQLTVDGYVVVQASESRSQLTNKQTALRKLKKLIAAALKPVKVRRATKPTKASKTRRLDNKTKRGRLKRERKLSDYA